MAQTVLSLLDLEGRDGKLALWAHNGHVGRRTPGQMGYQLDRTLGRSQVIIGFAFGDGAFRAVDLSDDDYRDFTAPSPSPGSLDETLVQVGLPVFAVDLRRFDGVPGEGGEWVRATHVTRNTGSHFSDDPAKHGWWAERDKVHEQYDVLVFVSHTTPPRSMNAK